ncbi:GntR family transcriptional regulator [Cognatishimia sp. WU-CL00825]|uniref:GntR family transcriptional regulator n=1 Tax=Cognatishimia sp. WU-CL00825 TaxID=3127658 RepID=UPI0031075484
MSRNNSMYKEAFNRSLDYISMLGVKAKLPAEVELSENWGISRTTVRAVLHHLDETDVIRWSGRSKIILRKPKKADYFAQAETISSSAKVETRFMEYILGGDLKPGAILRESELVREFDVSTSVVREFLIRFSRFGLIEKEPNRHWVLRGFTRNFAIELFDVREMFEFRAFRHLLTLDPSHDTRARLVGLETAHRAIIADIDGQYLNFPRLDEQFHHIMINELDNRFIVDFFELVSVIFHYHYRWNKKDEPERNLHAAHQHLDIIAAIQAGDNDQALTAFQTHLNDARATLLNSVIWDSEN